MEVMQNYKEEYEEIKICRLCGCDNKENVDIFSMNTQLINNTDDLLNKILTVYPLVLYKDDPLPQHICLKCINNVSSSYQDIQQVLRQQNKWMSLTKAVQPEHKYFRILRAVENSTKATKESIKISFNIELNQAPLKKLVTLPSQIAQDSPINPNLRRLLAVPSKDVHVPNTSNTNTKLIVNENVVKNIQSKLESNGFTIKRIKVATSTTSAHDLTNNTNSLDIQTITPSTEDTVSCKYCKLKFSNLKILAQHQLIHLNLSANKIFQKRLLPKNLRRGRLITINDSKTIRCLNCWRIYKDNKAILQHWSCGDCDFYCFICGKEFPQSPKLLREHIPGEHGISYRSAMRQFVISHSERIQPLAAFGLPLKMPTHQNPSYKQQMATSVIKKVNKYRKPPRTCTKNDDGTITCKVCHKVFDNFRSSNSHMRKHKPSTKYADTSFSSATKIDSYNIQDEYRMMQPTTSHQQWNPRQTYEALPIQKPSRPLYRVITKNGPLTGIKTKIVQKRQDFLASNKIRVKTMESLTGNTPSSSMSTANDDNLIVPELVAPIIKSEPIMENQTFNNDSQVSQHNEYISSPPVIKSEPVTNVAYDETDSYLLCFICNESFASNNDYQMHTMYVHNIH